VQEHWRVLVHAAQPSEAVNTWFDRPSASRMAWVTR
jgi:hypothetical protein